MPGASGCSMSPLIARRRNTSADAHLTPTCRDLAPEPISRSYRDSGSESGREQGKCPHLSARVFGRPVALAACHAGGHTGRPGRTSQIGRYESPCRRPSRTVVHETQQWTAPEAGTSASRTHARNNVIFSARWPGILRRMSPTCRTDAADDSCRARSRVCGYRFGSLHGRAEDAGPADSPQRSRAWLGAGPANQPDTSENLPFSHVCQ